MGKEEIKIVNHGKVSKLLNKFQLDLKPIIRLGKISFFFLNIYLLVYSHSNQFCKKKVGQKQKGKKKLVWNLWNFQQSRTGS